MYTIGFRSHKEDLALTAWPQMASFDQTSTKCDLGHSNTLGQYVEFFKSQVFIEGKPKNKIQTLISLSHLWVLISLMRLGSNCMASDGQFWPKLKKM